MKKRTVIFCMLLCCFISGPFSLSGQQINDFMVNENASLNGSEQEFPYIAGNGKGRYILAWPDKRSGAGQDIYAQFINSDGSFGGENFKVNESADFAARSDVSVAMAPDGAFMIVWLDRRTGEWNVYGKLFSGSGNPMGTEFQINEETFDEEQEDPEVSVDSSGNYVVIWSDLKNGNWDIYGQRFSSEGTLIGDNFRINDDSGDALQYWSQVKCYKTGDFIITWVDKRENDNYNIYAQYFNSDGTTQGGNFRVNEPDLDIFQLRPDIDFKSNGDYIITWEDMRNGDWDIYFQQFYKDGSPYGANVKAAGSIPGSYQRNASLAIDAAGNFTICWEDNRYDHDDVFAQRFSVEGGAMGECFKVNDDNVDCYQYYSTTACDSSGRFIIAWEDHREGFNGEIYAQFYENDGTPNGTNIQVNNDFGSEDQQYPSIAIDSSDNFVISWTDYRNEGQDIYAQRYYYNGVAAGSNFRVTDDTTDMDQWGSDVAMAKTGEFVVVWEDFRDWYLSNIFAQRYSAEGVPLGENFRVNFLGGALHHSPKAAYKPDGGFIITWGDSDEGSLKPGKRISEMDAREFEQNYTDDILSNEPDIWAQLFDAEGNPLGENILVNDDEPPHQLYPAVDTDSSGNFVIAWTDQRTGGNEIFFQRFLSDGTRVDSNIMVQSDLFSEYKSWPDIACDEKGNFVIVWADSRNGKNDIYGQRYSKDGTTAGENFRINSETTGLNNSFPRVSANDEGNFVVSWQVRENNTARFYAQKFLSGGERFGVNFQISETLDYWYSFSDVVLGKDRIFNVWHENRSFQTGYDIWANVKDWVRISSNDDAEDFIPSSAKLYQNYPNPFNPETIIKYDLPSEGTVEVSVFNMLGEKVKSLVDAEQPRGSYSVRWTGDNDSGTPVSSGIYFYILKTADHKIAGKMILLR